MKKLFTDKEFERIKKAKIDMGKDKYDYPRFIFWLIARERERKNEI